MMTEQHHQARNPKEPHDTMTAQPRLDVEALRADFPALAMRINGKPLAYLDNGSTTQKPKAVLNAVQTFYTHSNANVHRGVHALSQRADALYEGARQAVADFLHAPSAKEIVFTRGTTESINLVAQSYGMTALAEGDEVLITEMEHHANIVPWQFLRDRHGVILKVAPVTDRGELDIDALLSLVTPHTRLAALTHVSNVMGTVNPVKDIIKALHDLDVRVLVDGAQSVPHFPVNVQDLDADFYVFSSHKAFGPSGVGVLYAKRELLEAMPPYQGGGDMILSVSFEKTTYNEVPHKFEAGTPNIEGAVGMAAALGYLQGLPWDLVERHEQDLLEQARRELLTIPGLRLIGTPTRQAGSVSFVVEGVHPHDMGSILDQAGLAVRAGHHCAQPLMARFGVPATTRASLAFTNTAAEIDRLVETVRQAKEWLS